MSAFILATKSTQSQSFNDKGVRIPTTFLKTDSCWLTGVKTPSKHGYFSVKLGFGQIKNIKKPVKGELDKAGIKTPLRFLREFRMDKYGDLVKLVEEPVSAKASTGKQGIVIGETKIFVGDQIKPTIFFKKGDIVAVSGVSKGKGFQGAVKRHHFKGGPRTHGQSHGERAPGSIGMTTTPGRVFKGKRMAGRMGNDRVTVKGLKVVEVKEDGIIVTGLVPGFTGGLLEVRS